MRKRILILSVLIIMMGSFFFIMKSPAKKNSTPLIVENQQVQKDTNLYVLIAAHNLPTGSFVNGNNFEWQVWPKGDGADRYMTKENAKIEDLEGSVVRQSLFKGEPVTVEKLVKPGDRGFVSAILEDGKRAVSIQVNATTSISGLAFPGDYVDIILTHAIRDDNDETRPVKQVSETILKNIRLLALDQKLNDQDAKPSVPKNATVEVTPKQAEIIMLATELGRLSLSLRSLQDQNDVDPITGEVKQVIELKTFTTEGETSQLLSAHSKARTVEIVRASESEKVVIQE